MEMFAFEQIFELILPELLFNTFYVKSPAKLNNCVSMLHVTASEQNM